MASFNGYVELPDGRYGGFQNCLIYLANHAWLSLITIPIWQCVKTLYPCSSHQNSWDLWMFIPLKMVLIGIDTYPYSKMIYNMISWYLWYNNDICSPGVPGFDLYPYWQSITKSSRCAGHRTRRASHSWVAAGTLHVLRSWEWRVFFHWCFTGKHAN